MDEVHLRQTDIDVPGNVRIQAAAYGQAEGVVRRKTRHIRDR